MVLVRFSFNYSFSTDFTQIFTKIFDFIKISNQFQATNCNCTCTNSKAENFVVGRGYCSVGFAKPIFLKLNSFLDAESEQKVKAALEIAGQNRTTITIAHRLSSIVVSVLQGERKLTKVFISTSICCIRSLNS